MILAVAAESRPSRQRSLREPGHSGHGQGRAATRRTREEQGTKHPRTSTGPPMIAVPLACLTRGQPGPLGSARDARSAPLAAVTAALPKLIVRVRFSSPALMTKAQAREGVPGLGLAATASGMTETQ